jgi:glycosyltransferase involved in cell wall biosynthesis
MGVYNAEDYLREAVQSVLGQTFTDFEFIIIDDGSNDKSLDILKSYTDNRIILKTRKNRGLAPTLNEAISMAKGEYIARQDADDISHVKRLERQVAFLDAHRDIDLLGTNYVTINENGASVSTTNIFTKSADIRLAMISTNQFGHGTIVMRKTLLNSVGTYDEGKKFKYVEDFDLWTRMSRAGEVANLKEPLYSWRLSVNQISTKKRTEQDAEAFELRAREFKYFLLHKREYRLMTAFYPFSVRNGPVSYSAKKSAAFRNLAFYCLFFRAGRRPSLRYWTVALILAPWKLQNYTFLMYLFGRKKEWSQETV